MIEIILPAVISVIIMFGFAFFILKNTVKRINLSAKKYFVENMQEYNYLVDDKQKELDTLRKELEETKKELELSKKIKKADENLLDSDIAKKLEELNTYKAGRTQEKQDAIRNEIIFDIQTPEYKQDRFFKTYKTLRREFTFDPEKILKDFVKKHKNTKEEDEKYKVLKEFKNQFTDDVIYNMLTLTGKEQLEIVKKLLGKEQENLIDLSSFKNPNKFNIIKLLELVDRNLEQYNPEVYVYVPDKDLSYDNLSDRISTSYYKNMSEGVIIKYKTKIYDYSV